MAARVRSRPGAHKEDADEERSLWNQIRQESKRVDALLSDHNTKWERMREIMSTLDQQAATEDDTSADLEEELMTLSRSQIKLTEEIQQSLGGNSEGDMNALVGQIHLLAALRASSEVENLSMSLPPSRSASSMGKVGRNAKRKADQSSVTSTEDRDTLNAADSSAVASPKPNVPATTRLKGSAATTSRATSVAAAAARESSVKIEDSAATASLDTGIDIRDRSRLTVNMEVLFRKKSKDADGEGILCVIHSISGEGKQRRYELRDADPDSNEPPYRAGLQQMTPIPPVGMALPDLPKGKNVLALYPQTETFYKAEVVGGKAGGSGAGGAAQGGFVRLRFDGEEEAGTELDVERRYVLPDWVGK